MATFFNFWTFWFPASFSLFWSTQNSWQLIDATNKFCWCLEMSHIPLVSEATALPTEPQPLPNWSICLNCLLNVSTKQLGKYPWRQCIRLCLPRSGLRFESQAHQIGSMVKITKFENEKKDTMVCPMEKMNSEVSIRCTNYDTILVFLFVKISSTLTCMARKHLMYRY